MVQVLIHLLPARMEQLVTGTVQIITNMNFFGGTPDSGNFYTSPPYNYAKYGFSLTSTPNLTKNVSYNNSASTILSSPQPYFEYTSTNLQNWSNFFNRFGVLSTTAYYLNQLAPANSQYYFPYAVHWEGIP